MRARERETETETETETARERERERESMTVDVFYCGRYLLCVQASHLVSSSLREDDGEDGVGPGRRLIHVGGCYCPGSSLHHQYTINT